MSGDPRDLYLAEVVALLIRGPEGAETLRAALAGQELETPAYLSSAGPVLLFRDPDEDVRDDLPGIAVFHDYEPLPAIVEWIEHPDQGTPLALVPDAFLANAGKPLEPIAEEATQEVPEAPGPIEPGTALAANPLAELPHSEIEPIADNVGSADPTPAEERPRARAANPGMLPIELLDRPTDGAGIEWRIDAGRLVVTKAPIDPAAVPTHRQAEAAAALLRATGKASSTTLDTWRSECRSAWQSSMAPSSIAKAFSRCRTALAERGAIVLSGNVVMLAGRDPDRLEARPRISRTESVTRDLHPRSERS